jgi:competence protein ComEC
LLLLSLLPFQSDLLPFAKEDQVTVDLFDVGHGQSLLIDTPDGRVLLDTGGPYTDEVSLYEASIERVTPKPDAVVISHSDSDHSAGANYFRANNLRIPVWTGQREAFSLAETYQNCHEHSEVNDYLRFLPIPSSVQDTDNNHSCVLFLSFQGMTAIFTSDADKYVEYYLMQEHSDLLPVDLVILGHHGSNSSSATDWLELHKGRFFAVGSADRAAPKWPSRRIEQWFSENDETLYRTSKLGTVRIVMHGGQLDVKTWDSAYRNQLIY